MTIVEYSLVSGRTPDWISDGGHWINPDGFVQMIGVGLEGSIPDDATTFTLEELQTRQRAIHAKYPMKKGNAVEIDDMTDDEVDAMVKAWWDERS
jgi:hypothetical protein